MDRKESLKTIMLGAASLPFLSPRLQADKKEIEESAAEPLRSDWARWPDMVWTGPGYWANRLQDWRLSDSKLECVHHGPNRTLHSLTHQLSNRQSDFRMAVMAQLIEQTGSSEDYIGFRIGARARDYPAKVTFTDYRRDAVFGQGLHAGITATGRLFIGDCQSKRELSPGSPLQLELVARNTGGQYQLILTATEAGDEEPLEKLVAEGISADRLEGNVALVTHFSSGDQIWGQPVACFSDWRLSGPKLATRPGQSYGPFCFAQYTLDRGRLKLTGQLMPVELISGHRVSLQIRPKDRWETLGSQIIDPLSRTVHFHRDNWSYNQQVPYRLLLELPMKEGTETFTYEGTIAAEPKAKDTLRAAVFSCNTSFGFPNQEVVNNVAKQRADIALFLGDQFYEGDHGYEVERTQNLPLATLDYLNHWYMFGWSYRDIFRDVPSVFIPDDHDMFHGNIWGEGGKAAPTDQGYGFVSQDSGGYTMPAEWVRMVERTQTSHLPDPVNPWPVKQGIGVYFTDWTYGGVSFAILEDRKFKSAPGNVLPFKVVNGFPQDTDVDMTEYHEVKADLLGERQHDFLQQWVGEWSHGAQLKVVLSQSPFCGAHTLSKSGGSDTNVLDRPIPYRGEYPVGDYPPPDMDTNGWPQKQRDEALRLIRKGFALHLAGDQHLGSIIHYGIEEYEDAGYVFTLPALNNIWPRRWWPQVEADHRPLPGQPRYTGQFQDAFGNKMTVLAAANPVQTNKQPAIIYDRAPGYGMVIFDKVNRRIRCECWPRDVDPDAHPEAQYNGWPIEISQMENYGRHPAGYLPEVHVNGLSDPVIQLYKESTGELEYALRIQGNRFRPPIFDVKASYRLRIGESDQNIWKEYDGLKVENRDRITITF